MKQKEKIHNSRGSSLVIVLVTAAIGIVVSLSLISLISNMQLAENNVKFRVDANTLTQEVRTLLSDENACKNSFRNLMATPTASHNINQLRDGSAIPGTVVYSTGNIYGDRSVLLERMELSKFVAGAVANQATMALTLFYGSSKKSAGAQNLQRDINISLEKNGANQIVKCIALSMMTDGIWRRTPTDQNNISFIAPNPSGRVGIGTETPQTKLDIYQGNIQSTLDNGWSAVTTKTYSGNSLHHSSFIGLRARGTQAVPAYPVANNVLASFTGRDAIDGFSATPGGASIYVHATQNFNAANKGTKMSFTTTQNATNTEAVRMVIDNNGYIGISKPNPQKLLDVNGEVHVERHLKTGPNLTNADALANSTLSGTVIASLSSGYSVGIGENLIQEKGLGIYQGTLQRGAFYQVNLVPFGNTVIMKNHWGGHLAFLTTNATNTVEYFPMVINATNRYVGIGSGTSPTIPNFQLDVAGNINSRTGLFVASNQVCFSTGCTSISDERLKTNIKPLNNSLEQILKLQAVSFNWKDKKKYGEKEQIGFIAQQVEKVFPQVIAEDEKSGIKSVAYQHLIAPLIEAFKGLVKRVNELEIKFNNQFAKIDKQTEICKNDYNVLISSNEKLKKENEEIKLRLEKIEKLLKQ